MRREARQIFWHATFLRAQQLSGCFKRWEPALRRVVTKEDDVPIQACESFDKIMTDNNDFSVSSANYAAGQTNEAWDAIFGRDLTRPARLMVAVQLASEMRAAKKRDYSFPVLITLVWDFCFPHGVGVANAALTEHGFVVNNGMEWLDKLIEAWDETNSKRNPKLSAGKDRLLAHFAEIFGMDDVTDKADDTPEDAVMRRTSRFNEFQEKVLSSQESGCRIQEPAPRPDRIIALRKQRKRLRNSPSARRYREMLIWTCIDYRLGEEIRVTNNSKKET